MTVTLIPSILLAAFLIMWGFKRFVSVNNPAYETIMAIIAVACGLVILFTSFR